MWGRKQSHYPSKIDAYPDFQSEKVVKVVLGKDPDARYCGFVLTVDPEDINGKQSLWSYGDFKTDMLGTATASAKVNPVPEKIPVLNSHHVVDVASGVGHVAAIVAME